MIEEPFVSYPSSAHFSVPSGHSSLASEADPGIDEAMRQVGQEVGEYKHDRR